MNMFGTTCALDGWKKTSGSCSWSRAWGLFMCAGFFLHIFHCTVRKLLAGFCWSGHLGTLYFVLAGHFQADTTN